jgi:hypothetical protein
MRYTRRDLMKQIGIAMASLAATRCTRVTCYIPVELPTATPSADQLAQQTAVIRNLAQNGTVVPSTAQRAQAAIGREHLRACWQQLQQLATVTAQDGNRGETMRTALIAEHQSALDDLISLGEIQPAVAEQVQVALDGAAYHVWAANVPIICYKETPINYKPASSDQLARQSALLADMAQGGGMDRETIARAQTAVERDIAFLNLPDDAVQAMYDKLMKASTNGQYPTFDQVDLQIPPESADAARFLVELLLGAAG